MAFLVVRGFGHCGIYYYALHLGFFGLLLSGYS